MAKNGTFGEVPANGTDSSRGDYLPTVMPPAGLEEDPETGERAELD